MQALLLNKFDKFYLAQEGATLKERVDMSIGIGISALSPGEWMDFGCAHLRGVLGVGRSGYVNLRNFGFCKGADVQA